MYPLGKVDNKIFLNFSNLMPQSEFIFEIPGDLPRIFYKEYASDFKIDSKTIAILDDKEFRICMLLKIYIGTTIRHIGG